MAEFAVSLEEGSHGVIVPVRAHAGARQNAVVGVRAGALRVAVTAAPEKGKANQAIIEVLAKALGVPKSTIDILSGETTPQKRLLVQNIRIERLQEIIGAVIAGQANS